MSLAGPRAKSTPKATKPAKRSKKGPLSTPHDEDVVEAKQVVAEAKNAAAVEKGKGKQKEVASAANEKDVALSSSKPSKFAGKTAAPKKGILKKTKQQDPSPSTSEKEPVSMKADDKEGAEPTEEQEILLHGFSSESDSSDEDDDDGVDDAPVDVGKLPTIARDDASVKRRLEKAKKQAVCDNFQSNFLSYSPVLQYRVSKEA